MKMFSIVKNFVRTEIFLFAGILILPFFLFSARAADVALQGDLIAPVEKSPTNNSPAAKGKIHDGDFVGFDQLADFPVKLNNDLLFNTNNPAQADAQIMAMVPERIRAASGKQISVDGFMIPLEYKDNKVSKFILAMNQNTCCFGKSPQIHEFIIADVVGAGVTDEMDVPLRVRGVLQVNVMRTRGKLEGIYHLSATGVAESPE